MEVPPLFRWCSLLMASLFALSASFQLDDPDWYLWLPLYATACVVNLVNGFFSHKINQQVVNFALWLGVVLFTKVLLEDMVHGMAGFWSLDMRERVVREKFGSGLVISCMFLQSKASKQSLGRKDERVASSIQRGKKAKGSRFSVVSGADVHFVAKDFFFSFRRCVELLMAGLYRYDDSGGHQLQSILCVLPVPETRNEIMNYHLRRNL
ncbi:hypothetical protein RJ639_020803 [Escallonia herrerae]|uniref:Transmembrane protein n=1 Tax=Escallonia herrerae TaxID=1293975 RepID=A0AA88V3N6_9ASTE|nr:hypothetical protein RJ639_020803 [Escallonia herrerae]